MSASKGRSTPNRPAHARRPRRTRAQEKRRNIALVALLVIAILAGLPIILNEVAGNGTTPTTDASEPESTTTGPPGGVISPDLPEPPALLNEQGIRDDADMPACSTDPGTVQATGTVLNSGAEPFDIVVIVSWVTDRSDVLARGIAVLQDVGAGATSNWQVEDEFASDQPVTCVLTAKRGTLPQ